MILYEATRWRTLPGDVRTAERDRRWHRDASRAHGASDEARAGCERRMALDRLATVGDQLALAARGRLRRRRLPSSETTAFAVLVARKAPAAGA